MGTQIDHAKMLAFIAGLEQADPPPQNRPASIRKLIFDNFTQLQALVETRGFTRTQIYTRMMSDLEGIKITKGTFLAYFNAAAKAHAARLVNKAIANNVVPVSLPQAKRDIDTFAKTQSSSTEDGACPNGCIQHNGLNRFREHKQEKSAGLAKLLLDSSSSAQN